MNIQELIRRLEKIPDKTLEVMIFNGEEYTEINLVFADEDDDGKFCAIAEN